MDALSIPDKNSIGDVDLLSSLNKSNRKQDVLFQEALGLLETMKSSPSCNRMAVSKMVTSCQSIGGKPEKTNPDTHVTLEHIRSLYAARLAICELNEAGAAVPSQCFSVAISSPQKRRIFGISSHYNPRFNDVESIPKGQLESCLNSLESRPQWWTSYSNSRQNAVVICQAARIEIEKAELLELHKSIVQGSIKLDRGLQEAMELATAENTRHKEFVQSVEDMRGRLMQEMDNTELCLKAAFQRVYHDAEAYVGGVMGSVSSAIQRVHDTTTLLEKDIENASSEARSLRQSLQFLHDEAMERNEQMVSTQYRDSLTNNELVLSLKSSLEALLNGDLDKLSLTVQSFGSSLEWLSGRIIQILQQEHSLSERLQSLDISLSESQLIATELRRIQLQHNEAIQSNSQLQEHLQTNMRISQALLDKIIATAANLQTMVDETTSRYRSSPVFGGFLGSYSTWTIISLLVGAIGALNPKLAIIMLIVCIFHFSITKTL
ncbi:hypothetical protein BO71DRAFT_400031 [Aspergillus ellipticus CBS 707.79]|uniref:Nuclear membrane fusion protein Kar5 n=1 Tax=Aspergillus ellipticus CBS 707.79 TaxID=1448320 RepID=A0A319D726_9EURO|nr:hypothetical protein BO71DRAFT_400031 [Aspergillus ellipticus CBS 707.79]